MLTQADIDYMRRTADEYDALLKRWTAAPAYSQEIANLHATFKARAGDVGRMVENGLFRRVLATLDAGVTPTGEPHDDAVLSLADHHAEESQEDGRRVFERGGLIAFARELSTLGVTGTDHQTFSRQTPTGPKDE